MKIKTMTNHQSNQKRNRRKGHAIAGAVIALIGFFWLAKKFGWIPVTAGGSVIFWPAVTIAVGIMIILSTRRRHARRATGDSQGDMR
jgi:peptidoglycan biosynthesis protein MviN/MurJ (putative lipid II flippase)